MAEEKGITRRGVLKVLAGGAVGAAAQSRCRPVFASEIAHHHHIASGMIPGQAASSTPQFFNADEMKTLSALAETLIPTDEHSPGAVEAGVPAYLDIIVSSSAPDRKEIWKEGLVALNRLAYAQNSVTFSDLSPVQQEQLLLKLAAGEENPRSAEEKFFVEAKRLTIEGYYNSEIGLDKDLQYDGNTALAEFEGCTHPEHGAAPDAKG